MTIPDFCEKSADWILQTRTILSIIKSNFYIILFKIIWEGMTIPDFCEKSADWISQTRMILSIIRSNFSFILFFKNNMGNH